jgi:sugar/nucleoside kinase (ribokinase family)
MPATERERRRPPPPDDRDLDLLVVGEINPDVVVADPDPRPVFGQVERRVAGIRLAIGSSSAITACGAVRLGLRVALVGVVGDDALGRFVVAAIAARGVDVSRVRIDPALPTGASVVLSGGDDRAILTAEGAIGAVTAADVPLDLVKRARHLHVGSWFLQSSLWSDGPRLFATAHDAGLTTSLDPNWDPAERWGSGLRAVLPHLDVVLPNAVEAGRIAGVAASDPGQAGIALARLGGGGSPDSPDASRAAGSASPGPLVVVKAGSAGAVAANAVGVVATTAAYPVDAIDTTGAGDSFDAGFLDAWLAEASVGEALRRAAVCGALSTRAIGGPEAQPTRAEVAAALAAWPA